ncbi:MAG: hypothetical protein WAT70_00155 [Rhizobiaceae bacterium]
MNVTANLPLCIAHEIAAMHNNRLIEKDIDTGGRMRHHFFRGSKKELLGRLHAGINRAPIRAQGGIS